MNFILIILTAVGFLFSQSGYIEGIILAENLDTLAGANISIEKTDFGTAQLIKYMANCFFATKVAHFSSMRVVEKRAFYREF